MDFSVKMRLGLDSAEQWKAVIPILNDVPLTHITVHPRIATQQYKGEINMDSFRLLADECQHPLVYNGDILSVGDIQQIESEYGDRLSLLYMYTWPLVGCIRARMSLTIVVFPAPVSPSMAVMFSDCGSV